MLAYRHVALTILICSMTIIAMGWGFSWMNIWILSLLGVINLAVIIAASFCVCSGIYVKAHCLANTPDKVVSLTFDDGPHPLHTPGVLDLLRENGIQAGFFLIGKNIEGNEGILKQMLADGHIIGNHSYSHANTFGFYSTSGIVGELRKNEQLIYKVTGEKPKLFRPPFGVTNPNIARAVRLLGYRVIGWNIRSLDTISRNSGKTIARVLKRIRPGSVILLHDSHDKIIPLLKSIIDDSRQKGFTFVTPDKLFNLKPYK